MTDQFISSVKICTLHIRELKCKVTLQIHSYSKHDAKATAGRDTNGDSRRGQLSNKSYTIECRSIIYSVCCMGLIPANVNKALVNE